MVRTPELVRGGGGGVAAGGAGDAGGTGGAGDTGVTAVAEVPSALADGAPSGSLAAADSSELQVSTMHFHGPSACFLQISMRRPRSDAGIPRASLKRSS